MTIELAFNNAQDVLIIDGALEELLNRCIQEIAKREGVARGEVCVTFVTDDAIQELNRQYRHIDRPTDVLSFPMDDGDVLHTRNDSDVVPLIGDIVISAARASAQAKEYGHSLKRELGFLVTHGFLHLLGYDHDHDALDSEMFRKQEAVLSSLGLIR